MAEIPTAESVAWTKRPKQIPKLDTNPSRAPPRNVLRKTIMVSTPGVMVRSVMATR